MVEPAELMQMAVDKALEGVALGQTPFGCAIARNGEVIAVTHNSVLATNDITAHAEINALRVACERLGQIFVDGAMVASTCEPCPMCMSALHWARVDTVYFGASIQDAEVAGFNELNLSAAEFVQRGSSPVKLVPGLLASPCIDLFSQWKRNPQAQAY